VVLTVCMIVSKFDDLCIRLVVAHKNNTAAGLLAAR